MDKEHFNKTIIVQLVYVLRQVNPKKAKNLMSHYSIEIKSINGLINYRIQGIKHEGKMIIFLYGSDLYFLDLNKSLFDYES